MRLNPRLRPVLIVCQASLKIQWKRETEKWLDNPNVEILSGTNPYTIQGDILIVNYDILGPLHRKRKNDEGETYREEVAPGWARYLKTLGPKVMICDESTALKNPKADRTKAANDLAKVTPCNMHLTGTPVESKPIDIYNSVYMINPLIFPSKWEFATRFCNLHHDGFGWRMDGHSNTMELNNILQNTIMFYREKKQIMPELPEKVQFFVPVEIDNWDEYRQAELNFIEYLRQTKGQKAAEKAGNMEFAQQINTLKQIAVQGKLKAIKGWIDDMMEAGVEKLLIFAWHKKVISWFMEKYNKTALKLDGSVSNTTREDGSSPRQDIVDQFHNDPKIKLLFLNYEAGGKGYNLQNASNVAHIEFTWKPSDHEQATGRAHRMGQQNSVNEFKLVAVNTIEEYIIEVQDRKANVASQITKGEAIDEESMLSKIIKKYLTEEPDYEPNREKT